MGAVNVNVIKGFFERYIIMRAKPWDLSPSNPKCITQDIVDKNSKFQSITACLKVLNAIAEKNIPTSEDWLYLHFVLSNHLAKEFASRSFFANWTVGLIRDQLLCDVIRSAMSYIYLEMPEITGLATQRAIDSAGLAGEKAKEHYNALVENLFKKEKTKFFEMNFHITHFSLFKMGKEEDFNDFVATFTQEKSSYISKCVFCDWLLHLSVHKDSLEIKCDNKVASVVPSQSSTAFLTSPASPLRSPTSSAAVSSLLNPCPSTVPDTLPPSSSPLSVPSSPTKKESVSSRSASPMWKGVIPVAQEAPVDNSLFIFQQLIL